MLKIVLYLPAYYAKGIKMDSKQLDDEIKNAMKAKDNIRRDILRQVKNEVKNIEVNERRETTEKDVNDMLKRVIKQTSETLDASIKAANNDERTKTLQAQVVILEEYLPEQMSGDALISMIEEVIAETSAATKKDMGRVMGELGKRTGGNFDKPLAAKVVGEKLS